MLMKLKSSHSVSEALKNFEDLTLMNITVSSQQKNTKICCQDSYNLLFSILSEREQKVKEFKTNKLCNICLPTNTCMHKLTYR